MTRDSIRDYWSRDKQLTTPLFPQTMVHNHFLHILKYLHFAGNENVPDKNSSNYDRFWKLRKVFDIPILRFSELYQPTEQQIKSLF
jgi:hypothetical protein